MRRAFPMMMMFLAVLFATPNAAKADNPTQAMLEIMTSYCNAREQGVSRDQLDRALSEYMLQGKIDKSAFDTVMVLETRAEQFVCPEVNNSSYDPGRLHGHAMNYANEQQYIHTKAWEY